MSSFKQPGPLNVKFLSAVTEKERITVTWLRPDDYKGSYRYNVTWQSSDGANSVMTEDTEYYISNLVPGRRYNVSVTTETSDGTQGASRRISNCTGVVITDLLVSYRQIFSNKFVFQLQHKVLLISYNHVTECISSHSFLFDATDASPVKHLQCEGPNATNAELVVSWTSPSGQHSGFQVTVNDSGITSLASTCCNHTVSNLLHYTVYMLIVETLSCGQPSTPVSRECRTGITSRTLSFVNITIKSALNNWRYTTSFCTSEYKDVQSFQTLNQFLSRTMSLAIPLIDL